MPLYNTSGYSSPTTDQQRGITTSTTLPRTTNPYGGAGSIYEAAGQTPTTQVPTTNAPPTGPNNAPWRGSTAMSPYMRGLGLTPADVMGMNQMPARYLNEMLGRRGLNPTGGLFYQMEPLADVMMPLYEVLQGGSRSFGSGAFDPNAIGNAFTGFWDQMTTPGAPGLSASAVVNALLGGGATGSVLDQYLNTGTPEEQVENMRRYMMLAGQLTGSPMYQQALSNYLSRQGYNYLNAFTGGQEPTQNYGQVLGGGMGR